MKKEKETNKKGGQRLTLKGKLKKKGKTTPAGEKKEGRVRSQTR